MKLRALFCFYFMNICITHNLCEYMEALLTFSVVYNYKIILGLHNGEANSSIIFVNGREKHIFLWT